MIKRRETPLPRCANTISNGAQSRGLFEGGASRPRLRHLSGRNSPLRCALLFLTTLFLPGCGGGTTGTSATSDGGARSKLLMVGSASNESGTPLANTEMAVRADGSAGVLAEMETDAQGVFRADLPGTTRSLTLEMGGEETPLLTRSFSGSSAITTAVSISSSGTPNFTSTLEVKAVSECPAIAIRENEFVRTSAPLPEKCEVVFNLGSAVGRPTRVQAVLFVTCDGFAEYLATSSTDEVPTPRIDFAPFLSPTLLDRCSDFEISLSTNIWELPSIVFPSSKLFAKSRE